jgi:hypothetical protein
MPAFYELNYYARTFYSGNGSTNDFLVTFYGGAPLDPSHVRVYVNQTEISSGWSFVTINGATYVHFDIPPDGQTPGNVMLRRFTPAREADRVINFTDGDVLTASDLDMSQLNSLYVSQESSDQFLDQGGAGVSINFAETITGSKTFTGTTTIAPEGFFKFTQGLDIIADKTPGGKQYVLGANGTSGDVHWEETTINAGSLPATVVLTDSIQTIDGQKTFTGAVEINAPLKVTGSAVSGKALVSSTNDGSVAWSPIVNAIKLGSDVATPSTGTVVITPASIGAIAVGATGATQTVAGPVAFTGSVGLGSDVSASVLNVTGTLKLNLQDGDEPIGKVLTCTGVDGTSAWQPAASSGITSVNGLSGTNGAVTISAGQLGAVSISEDQTITGAKIFSNNVTLGTDSNDNIYVGGTLKIPGGTNGMVLMASGDGTQAIWQNATAAGVSMVNGATGPITISADSLVAYSPTGLYQLPIATGNQKGIMQVGGGLTVDGAGVVSVTQNATLPIAGVGTGGVLGGIRIGDNLSINPTTGVLSAGITGTSGVTTFKSRYGAVTPANYDYTASMIQASNGSDAAVTTDSIQTISAAKKFTVAPTVTSSGTTVGTNGSNGVSIEPAGLVKVQRVNNNDHVWEGVAPGGGVTSFIEADGDAYFAGLLTTEKGFASQGGLTIGQNAGTGISITGTLKFSGSGAPSVGSVMSCTAVDGPVGTVAWGPPTSAPVSSVAVNGGTALTGAVNIVADGDGAANGLGAVTKTGAQTITGTKTFSVAQDFQAGMKLGLVLTDDIEVKGTLRIPTSPAAGKVLTSDATGKAGWAPSLITSVSTQIGVASPVAQTGAVLITATNIGAATTGALTTLTGQVTDAVTASTNAYNTAVAAAGVAANKLSSVTITTTQIDLAPVSCLEGLGTAASPLKVLGASPLGVAGGDLASSYPSPTIGNNKVTYGKMQQVSTGSRLLGNAAAGTTAANVTEISLGAGLGFDGGQLKNTSIPTVSASGTNTFTGANTFQGNVVVGDAAGDALTVNATMSTVAPVTLGATSSPNQITINGPLKIASGSPAAGKFLTTDSSGNTSWAEPVVPPQWTINHYLAERQLFGRWNAIDTNPGQSNDTVAGAVTGVALTTMTAGMFNKWRVSTSSSSGDRRVDLVIAAGQSCYFGQLVTSHTETFNAAVGVTLNSVPTSITASGTTIGSSYAGLTPTLHSGPKTVTVSTFGGGRNAWFSVFRVS